MSVPIDGIDGIVAQRGVVYIVADISPKALRIGIENTQPSILRADPDIAAGIFGQT